MTFHKYLLLAGALVCTSMTTSCTPTTAQRGNLLENEQLQKIEAGKHSRSDVLRALGSPTTVAPFDDNTWYYLGQETEKRGILDAKIKKERIVTIKFAEDGIVQSVKESDDGRINIPLERESTPTHGNETTIMQEFFGNLGKFNPQQGRQTGNN
jgi:outer membrane protein assembly factor BamE (lipoprotein component of BamABCDE complex)